MATHWREIANDKEKYQAYLCSEEWGQLRRRVFARDDGKCQRCRQAPASHCHHLTYARKYAEDLADLQALCEACHDFVHGRTAVDPVEGLPKDAVLCPDIACMKCHKLGDLRHVGITYKWPGNSTLLFRCMACDGITTIAIVCSADSHGEHQHKVIARYCPKH